VEKVIVTSPGNSSWYSPALAGTELTSPHGLQKIDTSEGPNLF